MANPTHLQYTKEHEWIKLEGDTATVGITKYAADALGEIVYVDLPKVGSSTT
jgi:glycine cleavage system H protein